MTATIAAPFRELPGRTLLAEGPAQDALLPNLADNSVDAIVTDPPYEIDFARQSGLGWDNTGVAFDPKFWAECLRVTKPGGNLVAFGAPRTYHRLAVALEDAGWEIRDSIVAWVKAYGFPKALETQALLAKRGRPDLAEQFSGVQNILKPAYEPIIVARKPIDGKTLADNIITWGVGGLGIDECRVATSDDRSRKPGSASAGDIINMSRGAERSSSHPGGRWPTNMVLVHGPDCGDQHCEPGCPAAELESQKAGAARYFPQFHYSGRAAKSERPSVDGVEHHSVKPLALTEWLVRLAAPLESMVVLDPFAGSGTTAEAAARQGRSAIIAESHPPHVQLIEQRLNSMAA